MPFPSKICLAAVTWAAATTAGFAEPPRLQLPIACELGVTCKVQQYVDRDPAKKQQTDWTCGPRTYDGHKGTDIRVLDLEAMRRGVDVLAAADGVVARLRDGVPDRFVTRENRARIRKKACGNGVVITHRDGWTTQYCHLAQGSIAVEKGQTVKAGDPLGRVGLSGLTQFPHVHITVRHNKRVIDPFKPDSGANGCTTEMKNSLWAKPLHKVLAYRGADVLNAGFTTQPKLKMRDVEAGLPQVKRLGANAPALVFYARGIGLRSGDQQTMSILTPNGDLLARNAPNLLTRNKAQTLIYIGRKRPKKGWIKGTYTGRYRIIRSGKPIAAVEMKVEIGRATP